MKAQSSSTAHREVILSRLGRSILEAVERKDTDHPLFHGCIDWHSAVHGHWALLRIGNATGKGEEGAAFAVKSLARPSLEDERRDLASRPYFEMPYGRAWFLRLAMEYETTCGEASESGRLRPMADEVAASLSDYLETRPVSPETMEYASDSWALFQLRAWGAFAGRDRYVARVDRRVRRSFLGPRPALSFAEDALRPEFFSRMGNLAALVALTQPRDVLSAFLQSHPIEDKDLPPVDKPLGPAHHLGMNWSRAWALAVLSKKAPSEKDRARFAAAYHDHVKVGMEHHELHADEYGAYGHWVPQFAVHAITELDG